MGNKVNPIGMRLQVNRTWDSRWYADTKDYGDMLLEDLAIKAFIKKECAQSGISRVIIEVRKPELDAALVAESIGQQLERRVSFRRAMKRSVQNAMRMGALGIRVNLAGRLGGAEIARTEWYREGRVPLHTLRADIDYALYEAMTPYGIIGIKVFIFKGEIMEHDPQAHDRKHAELQEGAVPRGPRR